MGDLVGSGVAAVAVFAGTNVDDLIVLTALFVASAGGRPTVRQIWVGQYLGVALLVAAAGLAAAGLAHLTGDRAGLLGLVPLLVGLALLARAVDDRRRGRRRPVAVAGGFLAVAGLTLANGADNVSVYAPLFSQLGGVAVTVTIVVFAAMVALWCWSARLLATRPAVLSAADRAGAWVVPLVFMVVGVTIIVRSGVLGRL